MRLAFYVAAHGQALDLAINEATGNGCFSHVELVWPPFLFFSSSPRDGGCRFKYIGPEPGHWTFVEVPVTEEQAKVVHDFCKAKEGQPYNWRGDVRFIVPGITDGPGYFCSEVVTLALQSIGLLGDVPAATVSPNELFGIVQALGWA